MKRSTGPVHKEEMFAAFGSVADDSLESSCVKQDAMVSGEQQLSPSKTGNSSLEVDSKSKHTFKNVSSLLLISVSSSVN